MSCKDEKDVGLLTALREALLNLDGIHAEVDTVASRLRERIAAAETRLVKDRDPSVHQL